MLRAGFRGQSCLTYTVPNYLSQVRMFFLSGFWLHRRQPSYGALGNQLALELGERGEDAKDQLAGRNAFRQIAKPGRHQALHPQGRRRLRRAETDDRRHPQYQARPRPFGRNPAAGHVDQAGHGHGVDDALLQYLSSLSWEHINLTGDYLWRSSAKMAQASPGHFALCDQLNVRFFPFSEAAPE